MILYDITDAEIQGCEPHIPNANKLAPGDQLVRYVRVSIIHGLLSTAPTGHTELIGYVASIRHNHRFTVYFDIGSSKSPEEIVLDGHKVLAESAARALFPMLDDYEYKT